jgi:cell division protein FtsB
MSQERLSLARNEGKDMEKKDRIIIVALVALFVWCGYLHVTMSKGIQDLSDWSDQAAGVITRNGERAQDRLDDHEDRIDDLERHH